MSWTSIAFVWLVITIVLLFLGAQRWNSSGGPQLSESVDDPIMSLADMMRKGLVKRLTMRPRYLPKQPADPGRSDMMAAQILADQQTAHEDPGEVVNTPAPGEPGYEEPFSVLRVEVGQFTVVMQRGRAVIIAERQYATAPDIPAYPVPEECAELVTALAFEVNRLRHGW